MRSPAVPAMLAPGVSGGAEQGASRRIALVIGNGDYQTHGLANPVKDAEAMGNALHALGFEVMHIKNANREEMRQAVLAFQQRLHAGGVGLFYFAGHGMHIGGRTLLAPVDMDLDRPERFADEGLDLHSVLAGMSAPRSGKVNLAILDTCLNDPSHGDTSMTSAAPEQTLVAYATAAGAFAADGATHGMFTAALLREWMRAPDQQIEAIFERAAVAVRQATGGRQAPWVSSTLSGGFRLTSIIPQAVQTLAGLMPVVPEPVLSLNSRGVLPKDSAEQYELSFWESIKDSTHVSDYEAYLQAYPNGRFVGLAKARIERLRAAASKPAEPAAKPPAEQARPTPTPKPQEQARPAPTPKPPAEKPADRPPEQARPAAPPPPKLEKPSGGQAVTELADCPTCPALISVPAGAFTMGSNSGDPSEKPARHVTIKTPFAIGKYEVTVEQWNACVAAGGCQAVSSMSASAKNMPARDVSWDDAQQFVKWLSKVSGKPYRLPTEAEWEYAARGGSTTRFWWGEQMRSGAANCKECGEPWNKDGPTPVGSFSPNPYGLYDMNGSVWEWVGDCWHNTFKGAPSDGSVWDDANCRVRVIRGGSWREGASYMPSTTRFKYDVSVRHSQNGFRVARENK